MAAGGEAFAAGGYTVTWDGVPMGLFGGDDEAPIIESPDTKTEPINNTSIYAKTTIDEVYQGADCMAQFTCLEWDAGILAALYPYGSTAGELGVIATLLFDLAQPMIFTVVDGTAASVTGPTDLTANHAFPIPGTTPRISFAPRLRRIPLRFRFFPYFASPGVMAHFSVTDLLGPP